MSDRKLRLNSGLSLIRLPEQGSGFQSGLDAPRVSFQTLGCRLNQSESSALSGGFEALGFRISPSGASTEIAVINTCSVTHQAEAKCRAQIRRILKLNPETFIAVTGCYAQVGVEALSKMGGVDLIAGTDHKMSLPSLVEGLLEEGREGRKLQKRSEPLIFHSPQIKRDEFTVPHLAAFNHATRPNVKIQDGCDFFCTFCIIPYTRGRSRSRAFEDVLLEARLWAKRGHREIVLTGVNLGEYGSEGKTLVDLIQALEEIPQLQRIRISSIEPTTISDDLLSLMADSDKLCAFLHLPLQSGSDQVLKNMDRRYTQKDYLDFARKSLKQIPDLGIGADVMVGFPGESEADFKETLAVIESLPFSYLHVFPYSKRKGTRIHRMDLPEVHPSVIKDRSRLLCERSEKMQADFAGQHIGQQVSVLFEDRDGKGHFRGLTENYLRISVDTPDDLSGQIRRVRINKIVDGLARAELVCD